MNGRLFLEVQHKYVYGNKQSYGLQSRVLYPVIKG